MTSTNAASVSSSLARGSWASKRGPAGSRPTRKCCSSILLNISIRASCSDLAHSIVGKRAAQRSVACSSIVLEYSPRGRIETAATGLIGSTGSSRARDFSVVVRKIILSSRLRVKFKLWDEILMKNDQAYRLFARHLRAPLQRTQRHEHPNWILWDELSPMERSGSWWALPIVDPRVSCSPPLSRSLV